MSARRQDEDMHPSGPTNPDNVHPRRPGGPEEGLERPRRRTRRSALRRLVLAPGGWLLLVAGVLVFVTPLPFGLAMMAIAVMVLLRHSPRGRWAVGRLARRFPATAARVRAVQARIRSWRERALGGVPPGGGEPS